MSCQVQRARPHRGSFGMVCVQRANREREREMEKREMPGGEKKEGEKERGENVLSVLCTKLVARSMAPDMVESLIKNKRF